MLEWFRFGKTPEALNWWNLHPYYYFHPRFNSQQAPGYLLCQILVVGFFFRWCFFAQVNAGLLGRLAMKVPDFFCCISELTLSRPSYFLWCRLSSLVSLITGSQTGWTQIYRSWDVGLTTMPSSLLILFRKWVKNWLKGWRWKASISLRCTWGNMLMKSYLLS